MMPTTLSPAVAGLALLVAPAIVTAQLDDPGLEAPPPPKAATPPVAPPAKTTDAPGAPAAPRATTPPTQRAHLRKPRDQAMVPPSLLDAEGKPPVLGREAPIRQQVHEETSSAPTKVSDEAWEKYLVAPSLIGPIGLFRTQTAEVGKPLNFRVGSHLQAFSIDNFLIAGSAGQSGDHNSHFAGDLTIGATGPDVLVLRNLELYLGIYNSSNENRRTESVPRADPQVILNLGDFAIGLKGAAEVLKGLSLGGHFGLRFFNSISEVIANWNATNAAIDVLGSFDVRKYARAVPLRFHFNAGFLADNSLALLPFGQCNGGITTQGQPIGVTPCIRSRVVETFAYGIGTSRVRFSLAAESPLAWHVPWGVFGLSPFVEYHLEGAVGDGDTTLYRALRTSGLGDRLSNRAIQYLVVGLRMRPVARLVLDLGADFNLQSPGFQFGSPMPAWNIVLGAAYTFDPTVAGTTRTVRRTIVNTVQVVKAPPVGRIRGVVRDAKTKKAIAGATIKYPGKQLSAQLTDANGGFVSYGLSAGPVEVEVSMGDDYETAKGAANVEADQEAPLEVALNPRPPRESKLLIKLADEKGTPLVGGTVHVNGPVTRDAALENDIFVVPLPPGDFTVVPDVPGYFAAPKTVTIEGGKEARVELGLRRRPAKPAVSIARDAILIRGGIHFAGTSASLAPDGERALDELGDLLVKNAQLRRISIEVHVDNRGKSEANFQLTRDRAKAIVDYLVKAGVASERLTAEGFGASRPLVPNLTPANRAKNRRVEVRIVERADAATSD